MVIAAECPIVGKQALPGISAQLRAVDIFSASRLLPDLQVGIAQVPSSSRRDSMLELIERQAIKRVGVSPQFHELTNTAQALRYARVALNARSGNSGGLTVFDDSVLAVAAHPKSPRRWQPSSWANSITCQPKKKMSCSTPSAGWLANKGSVTNAAAQLHVHPNTVRHRLHRIEQFTGRSLGVPDELAEMCLAFAVRENMPAP